jgi:hypothetical protein
MVNVVIAKIHSRIVFDNIFVTLSIFLFFITQRKTNGRSELDY